MRSRVGRPSARRAPNGGAHLAPGWPPATGRTAVNLIGNMNGGTLAGEAEIVHRGRTTMVVDVRVFDALGGRAGR